VFLCKYQCTQITAPVQPTRGRLLKAKGYNGHQEVGQRGDSWQEAGDAKSAQAARYDYANDARQRGSAQISLKPCYRSKLRISDRSKGFKHRAPPSLRKLPKNLRTQWRWSGAAVKPAVTLLAFEAAVSAEPAAAAFIWCTAPPLKNTASGAFSTACLLC
jgi:hypothetical protein